MKHALLSAAFVLFLFITSVTASYADDGGGMLRPPSGDFGLMAR